MFTPENDERLRSISYQAGMSAFLSYYFLVMGLGIAQEFSSADVLYNPHFLLFVPWLFSGIVFLVVHVAKGYYTAVRDENTRTMDRLRAARIDVVAYTIGISTLLFLNDRLNIIGEGSGSLLGDVRSAVLTALLVGLGMWFFTARRSRMRKRTIE